MSHQWAFSIKIYFGHTKRITDFGASCCGEASCFLCLREMLFVSWPVWIMFIVPAIHHLSKMNSYNEKRYWSELYHLRKQRKVRKGEQYWYSRGKTEHFNAVSPITRPSSISRLNLVSHDKLQGSNSTRSSWYQTERGYLLSTVMPMLWEQIGNGNHVTRSYLAKDSKARFYVS